MQGNTEKGEKRLALGLDLGSTTAKLVLTENGEIVYQRYQRHMSRVRQTAADMLREMLSTEGVRAAREQPFSIARHRRADARCGTRYRLPRLGSRTTE